MPKPIKVGKKERMTFSKINEVGKMPNLIEIQTKSYNWFIEEGLREVFEDISPIRDYADNLILEFIDYSLNDPPKYEQEECKERDVYKRQRRKSFLTRRAGRILTAMVSVRKTERNCLSHGMLGPTPLLFLK